MSRGEQHCERGRERAERYPGLTHGPARRRTGVRGQDEGSSRLHVARLPGWPLGVAGAGKGTRSGPNQAWTIDVPCTLMLTAGSGDVAGPVTTEPLVMLNLLP